MYRIGIDLGGTNIAAGIVDGENKIVQKGSVPTNAGRHPDEIVKDMGVLCLDLVKKQGIALQQIEKVGIASPGSVDPVKGNIGASYNLNMFDYPIVSKLGKVIGVKDVRLENDANAAALGEAVAGSGKGKKSFVMITLGTGVGGGIVLDGKIYSGFNYAGGELGHMIIEHNGVQCSCGKKGCFEAYSSATGLIRMTKDYMMQDRNSSMWQWCNQDLDKVSGRTAFRCAEKGDASARLVCAEYIDYLATGVVNLVNIFQPEVFCIGGGVSHEGDDLIEPLREIVERDVFPSSTGEKTELVLATLGNDAGIIGASLI